MVHETETLVHLKYYVGHSKQKSDYDLYFPLRLQGINDMKSCNNDRDILWLSDLGFPVVGPQLVVLLSTELKENQNQLWYATTVINFLSFFFVTCYA